jgi:hypothetical protein
LRYNEPVPQSSGLKSEGITMKNYIVGFLICYTILITAYAAGLHNGRIASIQQACVERTSVAPVDLISELERGRR